LSVRAVSKSFGPVEVLRGITLDLRPGEIHALVGENGAGKSTLMRIMAGFVPPSSGQLLMDGTQLVLSGGADGERHGIVLLHQELNLVEDITVEESIFLGREWRRGWMLDKRRMRDHTARLLTALRCEIVPNAPIRSLTVSQRQMVEIAKATDHRARVLILDEPTSALTSAETSILFELLKRLKEDDVSIVFISHKLDEVLATADLVTVLRDGNLIATRPAAELDHDAIAQLMVGRSLARLYPEKRVAGPDAHCVMQVQNIVVPGHVAGASFELRSGEILGFAGLVGAGRTELMEAVVGLRARTAGRVTIGGKDLVVSSIKAAAAAGIAYLTEDRRGKGLLLRMPARPNLTLATLSRFTRGSFIRVSDEEAALDRAIAAYELRIPDRQMPVISLSGGNQQKLLFAKTLQAEPGIVIIDEPTRGVDIGTKQQIYAVIAGLARAGKGVIVVSSELPELIGLCHRIVVMWQGSITGVLEGAEIREDQIMRYATGLKRAA
jgi:ribose transport system ATP-binding protein